MISTFLYDSSFEGFLTTIFEATRLKIAPRTICAQARHIPELFSEPYIVETNAASAERVWQGLLRTCGKDRAGMFRAAFLSELSDIEMALWHFQHKSFTDKCGQYSRNVLDEHVYTVLQTARKVWHEIHLFTGFVRFQTGIDGVSYSVIEPEYNIVEQLADHFQARFPSMPWLIVDGKRHIGIHYDGTQVLTVHFAEGLPPMTAQNTLPAESLDPEEPRYRAMWKTYYRAINIPERKNLRLQARLLPRKYWKYLPERA